MAKFKPVEQNPDFIEIEKKLLDEWYSSGLVDKYLQRNNTSDKYYSFLDGPITANNPMGVHHAWGRTYKDLWQRFKNMQGYKQRFQNGFDCQGLWVEVEVEKELGLKNKRDIENLVPGDKKASIAKFVQLCKDRVVKYSQMQTEQSKRLGQFMDWENSYYTMSEENNYMIWTFLKKCHEKGLIYKGHDSVPWCPRCGTAISQHEMLTEDYKEVTHDSVYVRFPVEGEENTYLLIWTTTPWTLPANVSVAVDSEKEYAVVEDNGARYYMGKASIERMKLHHLSDVGIIQGSELVGKKYSSPFDHLPRVKEAMGGNLHEVVATDTQILPISDDEGTGLVHIATGAGVEDFKLGKNLNLPVIEVIDEEASYLDGLEEFSNKNAKNKPEIIIEFLKEKGSLFHQEKITHRYPACWRCKSELVWRVVDEWYISMDQLREPMKEVTKKIAWLPEFGLKRELDWLDNMHDWLISKKRYWGLALPIWVCEDCEKFDVVGDREELEKRADAGWDSFEGNTPHRPHLDEIKLKCECGGTMTRIPDVGNPWLDAGIVPYSTISKDNKSEPLYKTDKEEWRKWFPADFITESFPGQFKNWFYSLIAMSVVLEDEEPTKTILGFATQLAEDGRPMHKSWGNSIEFNEGADKIGVDIMRWMFAKQDPATNMLFGYKAADETRRRFFLILWNSYKFFIEYANLSNFEPQELDKDKLTVLDKWILSRLNRVVENTIENLEKYNCDSPAREIEEFVVNDLSTWYIRRSRDRVGAKGDEEGEKVFLNVTYHVFETLSRLMAPIMPFVSETIYKNLTQKESVHLSDFPTVDPSLLDEKLEEDMALVREVASLGQAERKKTQIALRQPLAKVTVKTAKAVLSDGLLQILKEELNIKGVDWQEESDAQLPIVELDTELTPELEEEGKTRDLARQIQEERKKLGTPLDARVSVVAPWIPENPELVEWIKKRTLTESLEKGDTLTVREVS